VSGLEFLRMFLRNEWEETRINLQHWSRVVDRLDGLLTLARPFIHNLDVAAAASAAAALSPHAVATRALPCLPSATSASLPSAMPLSVSPTHVHCDTTHSSSSSSSALQLAAVATERAHVVEALRTLTQILRHATNVNAFEALDVCVFELTC
jgi:hypothetical protein